MNSFFANANLATYALIFFAGLLIVSFIWTMIGWVLFPHDPLRWNTEARLEAAQSPANLLAADQTFRQQRFIRRFLLLIVVIFIFYQVAPVQTQAVADAIGAMVAEVVHVMRGNINGLATAQGG